MTMLHPMKGPVQMQTCNLPSGGYLARFAEAKVSQRGCLIISGPRSSKFKYRRNRPPWDAISHKPSILRGGHGQLKDGTLWPLGPEARSSSSRWSGVILLWSLPTSGARHTFSPVGHELVSNCRRRSSSPLPNIQNKWDAPHSWNIPLRLNDELCATPASVRA